MGRCPRCGREINYLDASVGIEGVAYYTLCCDGEYEFQYDEYDEDGDWSFYCPECGELLTHDEAEALAILSDDGGDEKDEETREDGVWKVDDVGEEVRL